MLWPLPGNRPANRYRNRFPSKMPRSPTPTASTIPKLRFIGLVIQTEKLWRDCTVALQSFAPIRRFEQNFAEVGVLTLSVNIRHHPDCKNASDKTWRRCSCPKWTWGSLNCKFIRQSAKTPWLGRGRRTPPAAHRRAGTCRPSGRGTRPACRCSPEPIPRAAIRGTKSGAVQEPRVTVQAAVEVYLTDAGSRGVAAATHNKLTTIFRKQFLAWAGPQGIEYLDRPRRSPQLSQHLE